MLQRAEFFRPYRWTGWLLSVAVVPVATPASGQVNTPTVVAVAVTSGRVFVGQVDAKSNEESLVLASTGRGILIHRTIDWPEVVLACSSEAELTRDHLLALARSATPPESGVLRHSEADLPPRPWPPDTRLASYIEASRANNTQVESLSIEAHVANWNRTVESDGIIVNVYPQNSEGYVVPVDATLDVELIASVPPGSPQAPLPRIGRWTVRILPEQFGPLGAVVKLPFQSVKPDFDLGIGPLGLVHATLNVPGNGSFETSQAMVRIRPYSAVRDQAQQNEGRRFFDVERVDRP